MMSAALPLGSLHVCFSIIYGPIVDYWFDYTVPRMRREVQPRRATVLSPPAIFPPRKLADSKLTPVFMLTALFPARQYGLMVRRILQTGASFRNATGIRAALIIVLTVAAYLPALGGGLTWDDASLIIENPMVRASNGLHRFWFTTEAPDYYPLTWSAWWLEWRLWGTSPLGYHVVNGLAHAVNAVLVWLVLRRLKVPGAWLAALVFALHPVNVATAAWISEQKNTLAMLFYAAAILLYLRFDEQGARRWYILSLAAFLLALLSKTAVVMLPMVLLGCLWWLHGKVRRKDWLRSLPFFGLSLALGLTTMWFQHNRAMGGYAVRATGFLSRLAAAGWVPWFYLYKALWPSNLGAIYPKWNVNASLWVCYLPGIVLLGCLALFWWKRTTWGRPLLFALGYFVVTLFPVLGFFDQGFYEYSLVADHWQYYSIVGVIALTVAAGVSVCRQIGKWGWDVGVSVGAVVLVTLGVATWTRARVYADSQTLWQDNLAKNPNAWVALNNMGIALLQAGSLDNAIRHYEQALQIKPDYADAHNNLGLALAQTGKIEEAIAHYEQALRLTPDYAEVHNNLGIVLRQAGRVQEAIGHYEQALQSKPDYAEVHYNLGNALLQAGKLDEAIGQYEQALRIDPDYPEAHSNLGNALLQAGKLDEAVGHYEQALRIKPDYAEVHSNLGNALLQAGKLDEAIRHSEQALRIKPDYAEAHCVLGIALEQAGRAREAAGHYEQALRIKPDLTQAQNGLARLQAGQ